MTLKTSLFSIQLSVIRNNHKLIQYRRTQLNETLYFLLLVYVWQVSTDHHRYFLILFLVNICLLVFAIYGEGNIYQYHQAQFVTAKICFTIYTLYCWNDNVFLAEPFWTYYFIYQKTSHYLGKLRQKHALCDVSQKSFKGFNITITNV